MKAKYFEGDSVRGPVKASAARTFQEVVNALQKGATLAHSRSAFLGLGEKQRNKAKQVPFFVAACFKNSPSKRSTDQATHCNLIFLDIDPEKEMRDGKWVETGRYPAARFIKDPQILYTLLGGFNFAAHLTASSTPEKPRMRIVVDAEQIPLNEYPAAVTAIAELLGLPSVTRESKVAVQPMFLPVRFSDSPADYQPVFAYRIDGRPLGVMDLFDSPSWISASGSNVAAKSHDSDPIADALEHLRAPDPDISLDIARNALSRLDPDCSRQEWIDVAAALKHQFSPREDAEAFKLFDEWSSLATTKYQGERETRQVWNSYAQTPKGRVPITIRTLIRRAKEGWPGATAPTGDAAPIPPICKNGEILDAYYDSTRKEYLIRNNGRRWHPHPSASFKVHLKARGFSTKPREGESLSAAEMAMLYIQNEKDVRYYGPLAGRASGFYDEDGVRFLVTDSPQIVEPVPGDCKSILALLGGLVGADPEHGDLQLATLTSWLKTAYQALRAGKRQPGQVPAFAGPVGCGKSLLQQIITALLGGRSAKAMRYMNGDTPFNSDLFGAEHLILEDEQSSTDIRARMNMAAHIKAVSVNDVHSCHGKGRDAVSLRPFWRASISLNDQEESLLVLPPITADIADKLMLLRCQSPKGDFPTGTHELRNTYWNRLMAELPAFAHYLTQYCIPRELQDQRFGVRYFHHPELVESLQSLAPEAKLLELIDRELWKDGKNRWEGTAGELESRLRDQLSDVRREAERLLSWANACGTSLGRIAKADESKRHQERRVMQRRTGSARRWLIHKPRKDDAMTPSSAVTTETANDPFLLDDY
jgi:hypothetical protein